MMPLPIRPPHAPARIHRSVSEAGSVVEGYASMLASMAVFGWAGRMRPLLYYARRGGDSTFEPSVRH